MRIPSLLIVSAVAFILFGCASSGRKLDPAKVALIQKGQTREDVLALVGSPERMTRTASGQTIFNYMFVHAQAKGTSFIPIAGAFMGGTDVQTQTLIVTFGPDGLVSDFVTSMGANDLSMGAEAGGKAKLDAVQANKRPK